MDKSPQQVLSHLLTHTQSLQLATLNAEGEPSISYAPFVQDETGSFVIFISGLATHTHDLLRHPTAAVLLIADEQATRQIFARTRVSYSCHASVIARDAEECPTLLDALQARFGEVVGVLRGLGDFVLFRLQPRAGRFVMGFGQAFVLGGEDLRELQPIGAGSL